MKKKILSLCLVVAMVATAVAGASMAFLTDEDSDVNVMTLGNVSIIQNEQQRVEANGEFTSTLEPFEDGKVLMPVTYPSNRTTDTVKIGDYTIELSDKEANYVDKIISVTNDGKSAAYVRTLVAVPTGGADWEPTPVSANNCWLHWNIPDGYNTYWNLNNVPVLITVDGVNYYVWEFIHIEDLAPNETTYPCVRGFYMDKRVDNDDNGYFITYDDGTTKRIVANPEKLDILVLSQAVQAAGFDNAQTALDEAFGTVAEKAAEWFAGMEAPVVVNVAKSEELAAAVEANKNAVIVLADGAYTTNFKIDGGKNITITGSKDAVLSGQIATTASNAGTLKLQGVTVNVDNSIVDSTDISQTGKSAIAIWGDQTVICENVTFNMSLADSTAITSWWDTGVGTTIIARNCTFNCNGQRPIRATGNVTVEGCTFNDPYRYAVQLTAKTSTATEMDKAVINFNNNTIVNGENGKAFVYGIQLEGADYGCHDLIINGSGNTISNETESTMYYCECGKVQHDTITWNTEVPAVHEVKA